MAGADTIYCPSTYAKLINGMQVIRRVSGKGTGEFYEQTSDGTWWTPVHQGYQPKTGEVLGKGVA